MHLFLYTLSLHPFPQELISNIVNSYYLPKKDTKKPKIAGFSLRFFKPKNLGARNLYLPTLDSPIFIEQYKWNLYLIVFHDRKGFKLNTDQKLSII